MIKASELNKGKVVSYEGELYAVHAAQHVAKGNKRSLMQVKLKSIKGGRMIDVRFSVDDRIETPFVESKEYEYLYQDGDGFVLMDPTTFDQMTIPGDAMEGASQWLKGNERITCSIIDGQVVSVDLPQVVELEVTDTTPVVKGATATNQNKDATLETGVSVKVPPFINIGDRVRIDTRSGDYVERAK